jgi:hypothetical protein
LILCKPAILAKPPLADDRVETFSGGGAISATIGQDTFGMLSDKRQPIFPALPALMFCLHRSNFCQNRQMIVGHSADCTL